MHLIQKLLGGMANSVDPDQTLLQEQSDLGLHHLHMVLNCLHMSFCLFRSNLIWVCTVYVILSKKMVYKMEGQLYLTFYYLQFSVKHNVNFLFYCLVVFRFYCPVN